MDPMRAFLSEENITIHREYMRTLRLRHSVMEKSIPTVKGASLSEISKMKLKKHDREEILENLSEYLLHDLYFKSFSEKSAGEPLLKRYYPSDEAFLYEILQACTNTDSGFVMIFTDNRGRPQIKSFNSWQDIISTPRLAIDLSEHAYFLDYGFDKERYLRNALSHLKLEMLTSTTEK